MRISILLRMIGAVTLVALTACGKRPVTRPAWILSPACEILPAPVEVTDTITVALLDAVESEHAPWARNASERLLFRHLYETLITVDCLGEIRAGLAESWKSGAGGRRWTFELREGARFWDGSPVTARDVVINWRDAMALSTIIDSATVAGDRVLRVYFKQPHQEVPHALSALVFAVTKPSEDTHWPLGSGPNRIVKSERGFSRMVKRPITAHTALGVKGTIIRFLETSKGDARDLLEGMVDVMVTSDPAVIEYAASHPQFTTVALPWDKTYVLLSTSRVQTLRRGGTLGMISLDLTDRLAQDAVRGDARGYRPGSWWDDLQSCDDLPAAYLRFPLIPRGAYLSSDMRHILYDFKDPIARGLAERIVALAATDPDVSPEAAAIASAIPGLIDDVPGMIAEGVTRRELRSSLRDGDDFAYIIAIPRQSHDPCNEAHKLINRVRWLVTPWEDFPKALIPLVDTRPHVIANSRRVGLTVDWYGNILIVNGMLQRR